MATKKAASTETGVYRVIDVIGTSPMSWEDAASYGLRMLRTAGLVQTRKDGRVVYYRLADTFPEPLLEHCLRELMRLSELAGGDRPRRRSSRPGRRTR